MQEVRQLSYSAFHHFRGKQEKACPYLKQLTNPTLLAGTLGDAFVDSPVP